MVARTAGAFPLFVILLAAGGLPAALLATRRAVIHLLRPVGSEHAGDEPPSLAAAALERGLQAGLILVTVWLVASSFGLDIDMLTHDDSPFARLSRGVLNALVIVLVADLAWHLASSWIDRRLFVAGAYSDLGAAAQHALTLPPEEARRRSRVLTLLPILRNIGFVVLAVIAGLMALSALGVQIGPLLAGAGVVGIAIGFGAQTLVKDIISGMFYLLDDAFRVGEYIAGGSYKGTVESLLAALDQAAAPPRPALHGAVRRARRGPEPEPRLGDRQAHGRRHLRHRPRQGEARSSSRSARRSWPIPSSRRTSSSR